MEKLLDEAIDFIKENVKTKSDEEIEIIRYGLEIFFLKIFFFAITLVVGIIMHSFLECLIFNLLFSSVRSFAGGYHAPTRKKCFFESLVVIVCVLTVFKMVLIYEFLYRIVILFYIVSVVVVFKFAPIDTENKKIDGHELKLFRKKTRIVVVLEMMILIIFSCCGKYVISIAVMMALIVTAILILISILKST